MSDIHVIAGDNTNWTLVFHFPVPDLDNDVSVNFRTALANSGIGIDPETGRRSRLLAGTGLGQINPAEEAMLDSGALFEHTINFPIESGGTSSAQLIRTAEALYNAALANRSADLQASLRYFGFTRDVT